MRITRLYTADQIRWAPDQLKKSHPGCTCKAKEGEPHRAACGVRGSK